MKSRVSKNILLADDSEFFGIRSADVLRGMGHRVRFVKNNEEVIDCLLNEPAYFDLFIINLQMPEINFFDVFEWVRNNEMSLHLPVLALIDNYTTGRLIDWLKEFDILCLSKSTALELFIFKVNKLLYNDIEHRRSLRAPTHITVDFAFSGGIRKGNMMNISKTGIFLNTSEGLKQGDITRLRFYLPEEGRIEGAEGKVVWINRLGDSADPFSGGGIHFSRIKPRDSLKIDSFVKKELNRIGF